MIVSPGDLGYFVKKKILTAIYGVLKLFLFCPSETDNLSPQNVRHNCKVAFDAGEALGIPRVIDPADMDVLTVPDKLAVMTYLYQLRAHFTGFFNELKSTFGLLFVTCST